MARAPRRSRPRGGARWLQQLVDELKRAGLTAGAASALGGVLKVELAAPAALTIEVKPREPGQRCFCETARFGVAYCGQHTLTPAQEAAMGRFTDVLRRVEGTLPEALEAAVGVGTPGGGTGGTPEHTIEYSQSAEG